MGCTLNWGCRDIYEQEKYQRPDWLAGKIYTQITTREDLSVFTTCLQLTGYDTILDITGSYTVFAPTDQAFGEWFSLHPEYGNSLENIPPQVLENLVERHILQNGWSMKQLRSLDIYGWIDEDDPDNDKPRGYKRQTIQKDPDKKYYVRTGRQFDQIVDSAESDDYRKVYARSRKYGPVYFNDYFAVNDLSTDDYSFYYDRSFESTATFYGKSKIVSPEIFAENGFIYEVDQVNDPLYNAEQILDQDLPQMSFTDFRDLIYLFAEFTADMEATNLQPEAKEGGLFDTLFTLNYPHLLFNIQEELTGPNTIVTNYTVRYQNGLLAPTNTAIQKLLDEIVTNKSGYPHWVDLGAVPLEVKRVIVNAHMADIPVYRTDIEQGFMNGAQDLVTINEADIAYKFYGSNCSFIGLDKAIVPRAFSSITGPVYLRPGYSTLLYALEYSKTLPALKEEGQEYAFYVQSDLLLEEDSSLAVRWIDRQLNRYGFTAFDRGNESFTNISRNQLTKMVLNQVGLSTPRGYASKEFIENLAGNFIVVNNEDNTVSGGLPNYWGYNGDSVIDIHPVELEELTDNGITYDVKGWFNTPITDMYSRLSTYPHFFDLIDEAGLFDDVYYTFPFLTEGELYTIFIPSEEALSELNTDSLTQAELQQIIKYHFVRGTRIWTDASSPDGYYETLRVDESSTEFTTKYSSLQIETQPDLIRILDKDGALLTEIPEQDGLTNVMIATDMDEDSDSRYDFIITSVIHEIDRVLIKP
jgi:uncharacterized surface protein with fasciclin (FAS1) repeats